MKIDEAKALIRKAHFNVDDPNKMGELAVEQIYADFKNKKCATCKKSNKAYNYMKKFIGYSCKDELFRDNIDPFPKGFGCTKWSAK